MLSLKASIAPDHLPLDAACDAKLSLVLENTGKQEITIYPTAAKLGPIFSYAGVGISWAIGISDLPVLEIRRWYGPPGNPPSPKWVEDVAVKLAAGATHRTEMGLCWIPNKLLEPKHLDPKVLDPQNMDAIATSTHAPAVKDRIDLAKSSVLVFGPSWSMLEMAMQKQDDFLRGHVVAFVPERGDYELSAQYVQESFMNVGTRLRSEKAEAMVVIG